MNVAVKRFQPKTRGSKCLHRSRSKPVSASMALLDRFTSEAVTLDLVLEAANLINGARSHHFSDVFELVETAIIVRMARSVDNDIADITTLVERCHSREDLPGAMGLIIRDTQSPGRQQIRLARAHQLTIGESNPRVSTARAAEQFCLTNALAGLLAPLPLVA